MARLIKHDGTIIQNIIPSNGKNFSDEEMCKIVDTDLLHFMYIGDGTILVCDEKCWLRPNPVLNVKASSYFMEKTRQWRLDNNAGVAPPVAGDVLICSDKEFGAEAEFNCYSDDLIEEDEENCGYFDPDEFRFDDEDEESDGVPFVITKQEYVC